MLRKIWQKYFGECHGLIFMVDGADEIRLVEAAETLKEILEFEELHSIPILFLLNKNDLPEFKSVDVISQKLNLHQLTQIQGESVTLAISALDMNGVDTALNWLYPAVSEAAKSRPRPAQ